MYVSYPAKALIKSSKIMSIIIAGFIMNLFYKSLGKRLKRSKYAACLIVTVGIVLFNYDRVAAKSGRENTIYGLSLCMVSITLDGLLGVSQDSAKRNYTPHFLEFQQRTNFYSTVIGLIFGVVTGALLPFAEFVNNNS